MKNLHKCLVLLLFLFLILFCWWFWCELSCPGWSSLFGLIQWFWLVLLISNCLVHDIVPSCSIWSLYHDLLLFLVVLTVLMNRYMATCLTSVHLGWAVWGLNCYGTLMQWCYWWCCCYHLILIQAQMLSHNENHNVPHFNLYWHKENSGQESASCDLVSWVNGVSGEYCSSFQLSWPQIYRIQRFTADARLASVNRSVLVSNWQPRSKSYDRIFFGDTKSICFSWQCHFFWQNLWQCLIHVYLLIAMLDETKRSQDLTTSFQNVTTSVERKMDSSCRHDSWVPSASSKIYSDHFTEDCFTTKPKQKSWESKTRKSPRKRIFKSPEPEWPSPSKVTQIIKCENAYILAHSPVKKAKILIMKTLKETQAKLEATQARVWRQKKKIKTMHDLLTSLKDKEVIVTKQQKILDHNFSGIACIQHAVHQSHCVSLTDKGIKPIQIFPDI